MPEFSWSFLLLNCLKISMHLNLGVFSFSTRCLMYFSTVLPSIETMFFVAGRELKEVGFG
jgi:hypothetical protein